MTLQDLKEYTPKERPVAQSNIRLRGHFHGTTSSGGLVLLQVLKVLEDTDLKALGHNHQRTFIDSSRHSSTHLLTEHRPWGIQISCPSQENVFLERRRFTESELILIREQQRMHQNMVGLPTMAPMAGPLTLASWMIEAMQWH